MIDINHAKVFLTSLAIATALAIACGPAAEPVPGTAQQSQAVAGQARATLVPAAAQAATETVVTAPSSAPGKSPRALAGLPPVGTGVGDLSPGYGLLLADGSTVTSGDLTKAGKPVFLMFTATW